MLTTLEVVLFGAGAGLAVGITGGGGAVVAVPLLVYVLGLDAVQAVAISVLGVGVASVSSFLSRVRRAEVDAGVGALLSAGGIASAPFGAALGARLPEAVLLGAFGLLAAVIALRMWATAGHPADMTLGPCAISRRRSWRCISVLSLTGLTTGLLSGIFGVGGGFIVVPAVVFATGLPIHRAVATSLMVVSIVSAAAFGSMILHGRVIAWTIAFMFLTGGLLGMWAGTRICHLIPAARLQQGFALLLGAVGLGVLVESLVP